MASFTYQPGPYQSAYRSAVEGPGGMGGKASGSSSKAGGGISPGGAMFVSSIISGVAQIYAGHMSEKIAEYNAQVIEARNKLIQLKQDIDFGQWQLLQNYRLILISHQYCHLPNVHQYHFL